MPLNTNGADDFTTLTPRGLYTPCLTRLRNLGGQRVNGCLCRFCGGRDSVGTLAFTQLPSSLVTNGGSVTLSGTFSGNGGGLTNLSATNLLGTLADAHLSSNVALLNATNAFTGTNRFAGVLIATNINNQITGTFTGNGGGLTNLSGKQYVGDRSDVQ